MNNFPGSPSARQVEDTVRAHAKGLAARNLSLRYGQREVLKSVTLACRRGELVCVLGPNGAGKSSLFRCLLQLERGYSGDVLINGSPLRGLRPCDLAGLAAYIPQAHEPTFDYLVEDMVLMGAARIRGLGGQPRKDDVTAAHAALERLSIGHLAARSYARLSGGERQLVLIARALAQRAPYLVMDEPAASLDYGNQARLLELAVSLARSGYGVLMSTHNPEHAYRRADRAAALHDGRLVADGPPREVLTEALLEELYRVKVRIAGLDVPELPGAVHPVCLPGQTFGHSI